MAGVSDDFLALHFRRLHGRSAFVVEAAGEVTAGAVSAACATQHAVEAVEEPAADGKADEKGEDGIHKSPFVEKSLVGVKNENEGGGATRGFQETLIQSLSDFTLEFLCIARNNLTRIVSYLRKVMTKLCIKILVKSDSAI